MSPCRGDTQQLRQPWYSSPRHLVNPTFLAMPCIRIYDGLYGLIGHALIVRAPEARYYVVLAMGGDLYITLSGRGDDAAVRAIGLSIR